MAQKSSGRVSFSLADMRFAFTRERKDGKSVEEIIALFIEFGGTEVEIHNLLHENGYYPRLLPARKFLWLTLKPAGIEFLADEVRDELTLMTHEEFYSDWADPAADEFDYQRAVAARESIIAKVNHIQRNRSLFCSTAFWK